MFGFEPTQPQTLTANGIKNLHTRLLFQHLGHGFGIMARILWHVGIRSSWRDRFWKVALPLLRAGKVEDVINIAIVSHHLITFVGEIKDGKHEACFYADPSSSSMDASTTLATAEQRPRTIQAAE